jgi:transposase InsO family protein
LRRDRFPSFEHAEHEGLHWIGFYNEERLHEELGDLPEGFQNADSVSAARRVAPSFLFHARARVPNRAGLRNRLRAL